MDYWEKYDDDTTQNGMHYLKSETWGEEIMGMHGVMFIGAFCDGADFMYPLLMMYDNKGHKLAYDEAELVSKLEQLSDENIEPYSPDKTEEKRYQAIYDSTLREMLDSHEKNTRSIKEYNRRKVENWERIRHDQLNIKVEEMNGEIEELKEGERASENFYEKVDIMKKVAERTEALKKFQASFHEKDTGYKQEGDQTIEEFNRQFEISNPVLMVNTVLKF